MIGIRIVAQATNIQRVCSLRPFSNAVRTSARRCSSFASNRAKLSSLISRRSDRYVASITLQHTLGRPSTETTPGPPSRARKLESPAAHPAAGLRSSSHRHPVFRERRGRTGRRQDTVPPPTWLPPPTDSALLPTDPPRQAAFPYPPPMD